MTDQAKVAQVAALFDTVAADYDAQGVGFFQPIASGLVDAVAPRPGERVADLGCGKGAATLPLARAVGPEGHVDAVDISTAMVEQLRARAAEAGLGNVLAAPMDVRDPMLPRASYDLVCSSLVLFFLPDPAAALRSWLGLLRPGGRLGVATFGPADDAWRHVDSVFDPYLEQVELDARSSGRKGPFASDAGMEELVAGAGFAEVRTRTHELEVRFADVRQWHAFGMSTGQRRMWALVPEADRADLVEEARRRLELAPHPEGGYVFHQQIRYTLGVRV